jgi:hypothetical protein
MSQRTGYQDELFFGAPIQPGWATSSNPHFQRTYTAAHRSGSGLKPVSTRELADVNRREQREREEARIRAIMREEERIAAEDENYPAFSMESPQDIDRFFNSSEAQFRIPDPFKQPKYANLSGGRR